MRTRRRVALLVAAAAVQACAGQEVRASGGVATSDSAGVAIVTSSGAIWTTTNAWTLDSAPTVVIGEHGDTLESLAGIASQLRLPDGSIAMVPRPASELRFYAADGKFLRTAGRAGPGPGEFRSISGMFSCGGDSILVADVSRRISIWTASGEFVRESVQPVSAKGFNPVVVGASGDCASILVRDARPLPPDQQSGRHLNQLNWRPLSGAAPESVTTYPGIEAVQVMYNDMPLRQAILFSNQPEFALGPNSIVVGPGDTPEFRVFDIHGALKRVVRWNQKPQPVTDSDRAVFSQMREEYIKNSPEDGRALPPIDLLTVAKTKPVFARIILDDSGNTWLCECADRNVLFKKRPAPGDEQRWTVFDSTGALRGMISVPALLNVQRIDHDQIGGVWTGDDDVPSLRIYRIRKPGV